MVHCSQYKASTSQRGSTENNEAAELYFQIPELCHNCCGLETDTNICREVCRKYAPQTCRIKVPHKPRRKYPHGKAQQELNIWYTHLEPVPCTNPAPTTESEVPCSSAPKQHSEHTQGPKHQHHIRFFPCEPQSKKGLSCCLGVTVILTVIVQHLHLCY